MAKKKTEPFQWKASAGILTQPMLREYMRWLFPQLGAAYIPPHGVRDFTLGEQNRNAGKQPQPFRPRASIGPVMKNDLILFKNYVFDAIGSESNKNPYQIVTRCSLVFVAEFKKLHAHIVFIIAKKRAAA